MDYGWYTSTYQGSQRAGFFVDKDNRLLYWPQKEGPGHVIDETIAEQIISAKQDNVRFIKPTVYLIILCALLSFILARSTYLQDALLIGKVSLLLALYPGLLVLAAVIIWPFYEKLVLMKREQLISVLLKNTSLVHAPRPPVQHLKFSEDLGGSKKELWKTLSVLTIILFFLIFNITAPDNAVGDSIVLWTYTVGVLTLILWVIRLEVIGLREADLRFYDAEIEEYYQHITRLELDIFSENNQSPPKRERFKFLKAVGWTLVFLIGVPLIIHFLENTFF